MVASFVLFFLCFLGVGLWSARHRRSTAEDYHLASRSVSPWLMALSAVSTNNSGFMFIGLIGATYAYGISMMWLMIGWMLGDYVAWRLVHKRFRRMSESVDATTIPSFVSTEQIEATGKPVLQRTTLVVSACVTIVFLGTYSAAQLTAGSKALNVMLQWDYSVGALLSAGIVAAYCFFGGIRATIWTDAAQAIVMITSMGLLLVVALVRIGGIDALFTRLREIDSALVSIWPADVQFGVTLHIAGWICAGVGVLGQPHVMVRAMAINSTEELPLARRVYFVWYIVFSTAAVLVGLACRVLVTASDSFDVELALPLLSSQLLPDVVVGFVLAGLFSATISTADSQILACSAAVTHDLFPRFKDSYFYSKVGTIAVIALVITIVWFGTDSVFELVVLSWSALASTLGPLLVLRSFCKPVRQPVALAMMFAGLAAVIVWRYALEYSSAVYDVLPGICAGSAVYGAASWSRRKDSSDHNGTEELRSGMSAAPNDNRS